MGTQTLSSGSRPSPRPPFPRMRIVSVSGPTAVSLELAPPGPILIGRRLGHDIQLADPASRDHAMLVWAEHTDSAADPAPGSPAPSAELAAAQGHWCLIDTDSKHGTRLNGEILKPQMRFPLEHGDLIQVTHWTLQVVDDHRQQRDSSFVAVYDDDSSAESTLISEVRSSQKVNPSQRRLALILECATAIHQAGDTQRLAEAVLDALVRATGLPNAAFLKPLSADGQVSVVSNRGAILSKHGRPNLSRSLLERASSGVPVRMNRSQGQLATGASILELGIEEALCAPIMLSGTVAGYIYVDSRRADVESAPITADAAEFVLGLSQITAMAMANLMRLDLQKRYSRIEADIAAAAEAQRWVLPTRSGDFGALTYLGESRPGKVVSGDYFDVIGLDGSRLAVTLGDVSGKGIAASVLMTVAQGFLHGALAQHGDPARAARDLNEFVEPRCVSGRFVTLWIGVLDAAKGTLIYVDAGHGYALGSTSGRLMQLNEGGGMPIGIAPDATYENVEAPLAPGSRVLVVSDGLIEQVGRDAMKDEEFGFERVKGILQSVREGEDEVAAIFDAIDRHAGGPLADDATAVLVRRR